VYYWIVRATGDKNLRGLRGRLVEFERVLKENKELANVDQDAADAVLLEFGRWRRSPNDQKTLELMHDLVCERIGLRASR
jgi:hypothetical protein